jgi:hypothetical protein
MQTTRFSRDSVICNLKSDQGKQLVAAYHATYSDNKSETMQSVAADKEEQDKPHIVTSALTRTKSAIMNRFWGRQEGEKDIVIDEVVYPIVGATLVAEANKCRVLPSANANAACTLQNPYEDVYGWYSPACILEE